MDQQLLLQKLRRLLGPEGLETVGADMDALERDGRLPGWLLRLADAAEELPLPEVPPVVTQDLKRLFDGNALLESQHATLIRDSRYQRDLVGVRGTDAAEGWSMSYTSEMADVVLDLWPQADGTLSLEGQVMAHGAAESAYRAHVTGPVEATAHGDRLGRFRIDSLTPGSYTVVVGNGTIELSLDAELDGSR